MTIELIETPETITVIKRDGTKVEYDENKIFQAILSSFIELDLINEGFDNNEILEEISDLTTQVTIQLLNEEFNSITVDEIQEEVFDTLLNSEYKDVAKGYIQYAERKNVQRENLAKLNNQTTSASNIKVSKKNGRIEEYNDKKLKDAIRLAAPNKVSKGLMSELVAKINKKAETLYAEKTANSTNSTDKLVTITTEQLHDIVENVLTDLAPEIYEQYAIYRRYKKNMSKSYDAAKKDTERILFDGDNENANRDSQLNSTKQTLTAEAFMKRLVRDFELSPEIRKAHDEGWIYIHDIGPRYLRQINCCLFDMSNVLKGGFTLNGVKYAEPKSFASAIALVGDVTLQASGQQYGGFTVPEIDTILAPYAERSYQKNLNMLKELDTDEQQLEKLALKMTLKEIEQGVQGYSMKLNTISSSLGQIPFNTITFGLNTSFWGREITKTILKDRLNGIGEDKITAVFPKLVMLMRKEINRNEDAPNRDIYDLAIECSQKRLYPDYLSLDGADIGNNLAEIYERSGKVVSPMGCVQGIESVYWNDGVTSIERMWNNLSKQFPVKIQPDGVNKYIDLEGIEIADSHTGEKKMVECKRIVKNKATDWLEIKLKGGRVLKCTPDHPLPVVGKGRMEAKDLKVGMELTASKPINAHEEKQIFGVEKAWLLGLILCDGCLNEPSEILISYANTGEDEIRERIGQMFNQDRLRDIQQSRGVKGTYKEVAIKDRELRDLCVSLFNGMRKSERMLPKEIFNASREERIAFLAGMIDADGHIAKTRNTVQLGSVNPEIAYGQKELAESLGIRVNMYPNHYNSSDNTKIRWRVEFPATKELVDALACEKKFSRFYELRNKTIDPHYYITSIEKVEGPEFSYDVTTESDYFDVSGIVSHNCRAYLSPYWDGDKEIYTGRGNTGAVTLNLPKIAIESKGDINKFYEMIDMYSELIWDFHESYINKISKQKASTSPLFYVEGGAWKKLKPDEEIGSVIKAFTSSLGYIGVEEAIRALTGGTLKNNQELGLEIVAHLKKNADNATKNRGFLAALYSTPAESLCYTFQKMNKAQYGEIEGVTDREYITNSFHIPVWEQITVPEKIAFEEPFQKIATGGKISYTEFPYGTPLEVLQEAVDFAMDKGDYYGTNIVSSTCSNCYYEGDFRDKCPKCGSYDITVVSRVCGYLSFERMQGDSEGRYNPGKKAEILERIKHHNLNEKD